VEEVGIEKGRQPPPLSPAASFRYPPEHHGREMNVASPEGGEQRVHVAACILPLRRATRSSATVPQTKKARRLRQDKHMSLFRDESSGRAFDVQPRQVRSAAEIVMQNRKHDAVRQRAR